MLFTKNVPEKLIQTATGHRSLECLGRYDKTTRVKSKSIVSKYLTSSSQYNSLIVSETGPSNSCTKSNAHIPSGLQWN